MRPNSSTAAEPLVARAERRAADLRFAGVAANDAVFRGTLIRAHHRWPARNAAQALQPNEPLTSLYGWRGGRPVRDLDALYREHADAALRLAWLLTGEREAAEDLVQEAFVRCAARLTAIREPAAFGGYLHRTIANLATTRGVRRKMERDRLARLTQPRPPERADLETRDALRTALLALPARHRAALVLRFYLDCSEADTAAALNCRPGTVKSAVSRGLAALRADPALEGVLHD